MKHRLRLSLNLQKKYGDRYAVGTISPSGRLPSSSDPSLKCDLDFLESSYLPQIRGLVRGDADAIVIETTTDLLELKTIISTIKSVNSTMPIIANVTFPNNNAMMLDTPVDAAYVTISNMGINLFGINCATEPEDMIPHIEWLNEYSEHSLLIVPNAGIPENADGDAVYTMTPDDMCKTMKRILDRYSKVRIIGGCCGTTPNHIKQLRTIVDDRNK